MNWQQYLKIHMRGTLFGICLFTIFCACGKKFIPAEFLPLSDRLHRFSGPISQVRLTADPSHDNQYIAIFSDSLGLEIWREVYVSEENRVLWRSFAGTMAFIPSFHFEPPIPLSPFSDQPDMRMSILTDEVRESNAGEEKVKLVVDYHIVGLENLDTPAGRYSCIRMAMEFHYADAATRPYLADRLELWYAKGVGMVKYRSSGEDGVLQERIQQL